MRRLASKADVPAPTVAGEGRPPCAGDRRDAGQAPHLVGDLRPPCVPGRGRLRRGLREPEPGGRKPERRTRAPRERRAEEYGDEQHEHAEGCLGGDQPARQPAVASDAAAALQHVARRRARRTQRRQDAEEQCHGERQRDAEAHHPPVEPHLEAHRVLLRRKHRHHERRRPPADQCTERRGERRQQRALDEHQPDQPPAAGADRDPQRHLATSRQRLSVEQVGDVHAGDQQHDRDERCQHEERSAERLLRLGGA